MKTFREFALTEGLIYTIKDSDFEKFKDKYTLISTDKKIDLYGINKEILFSYNQNKHQITVLKQGWQLMNVKRGY